MFKCPNCGGSLIFDIQTQKLRCLHCSTVTEITQSASDNSADETEDAYGVEIYACPNCGAELVSPEASIVSFCSYCGSELVLQKKMGKEKRPRYVIPFKITKEECRRRFLKDARVPFMPRDFKNEAFLENFRGIYMPYWMYDISYNNNVSLPAEKVYRKGNYEYTDRYDIHVTLKGNTYGVPYDASKNFDDNIALELAPFDKKDLTPFKEEYLAGFYADRSNVKAERYRKDAIDRATEEIITSVDNALDDGLSIDMSDVSALSKKIGAAMESFDFVLFPVWFLTWRKNDRVAYAVMNGETGKLSFDMPVDIFKMLVSIAVTAVIFFFVLNQYLALTARVTLTLFAVLVSLTAYLSVSEIRKIHNRELHLSDKGFGRTKLKKKVRTDSTFENIALVLLVICAGVDWIMEVGNIVITGGALVLNGFLAWQIYLYGANINKTKLVFPSLLLCIASTVIFAMFIWNPVSDLWYYGAAIFALAAVLSACLALIGNYNLLATRPIPTYTDRKGGDNSAKDY